VYSDLPNDLSNLPDYSKFIDAISNCAKSYFRVVKPNAFVCIITSSFRIKNTQGVNELVDFPGHTIEAFRRAGFSFWQDVVLSRNFASAAGRSTTSWRGKKLIPRHERLLVFRKT
jgi:DNA modification methylase